MPRHRRAGTTYPTGRIQTGDPVYTQLARRSRSPSGTGSPDGSHRPCRAPSGSWSPHTADGWTGTLTSGATSVLRRRHPRCAGPARSGVRHRCHEPALAEVGASGGGATLTVTPKSPCTGAVEGHRFVAASPAGISFALTRRAPAHLDRAGGLRAHQVATGVETDVRRAAPDFSVLSVGLPIGLARLPRRVVLALALVVLVVAAWIGRKRPGSAADDILLRSAARIVPVTGFTPGASVVDVSDAESAAPGGRRLDALVLHLDGEDGHTFAVRDMETTYRYVLPNAVTKPKPPPAAGPITRPLPRLPAAALTLPEEARAAALVGARPPSRPLGRRRRRCRHAACAARAASSAISAPCSAEPRQDRQRTTPSRSRPPGRRRTGPGAPRPPTRTRPGRRSPTRRRRRRSP